MTETKRLNSRQIRFIDAYLANGGNGTEAATSAGYKESGASVQAYKLLQLPENLHVQRELKRRQQELQRATGATAEAIRQGLWEAFSTARQNLTIVELDELGNTHSHFDSKAAMAMSNIAAELNKMDGNHAAVRQKLELSGGVTVDHADVLNAARRRLELAHQEKQIIDAE